jgi:hypothetical protein
LSEEKYGFVYLWYDRKHKRYYIGCHWGTEDDGYICSSNWMRDSYRRRPQDFKRRTIKKIFTTRKDLFDEETRYLQLIKTEEIGKRYYNLHRNSTHHWLNDENKRLSVSQKISATLTGRKLKPESIEKRSAKIRGQKRSEETKRKQSESAKGRIMSEETRKKLSDINKGKKYSAEVNAKKAVKHTDEMKAHKSMKAKEYWAKKKAEQNAIL